MSFCGYPALYADVDRPKLSLSEIDRYGDFCPLDGVKYGHTIVIVDTTSPLSCSQFALMDNLIFGEEALKTIPPYDRLSIVNISGRDIQASENKLIFSKCRPRSGSKDTKYNLDRGDYWNTPAPKLEGVWKRYKSDINESLEILKKEEGGSYTQLLEQIKEISRLPKFGFLDNNQYRKLIIVSDLIQNSKKLNLYEECKTNCITWDKFKKNKKLKKWTEMILPDFGENPPQVQFIFLNENFDQNLDKGVDDFWRDYFIESGVNNFLPTQAETGFRIPGLCQ